MSRVAIIRGTNPVETTVKVLETIETDVDSVISRKKLF